MSTKQDMTEESKRASWAWIALREFLYIAGIFLAILFIWFFDQEEKPISEIIKNIQNLRFPQDYYIFAIVAGVISLIRLAYLTNLWWNKAKILPESRGVPSVIHIGKIEIKIENDLLLFTKKGFLKSRSWKERKSELKGVELSGKFVEDSEGTVYFEYFVELVYLKQSKTTILCKELIFSIKEFISIRKTWKETTRALGLPAIEEYLLGSLWRGVLDLDKSIRVLAKENKISFNFNKDSDLPTHTELLQKDEELTVICLVGLLKLFKRKIIISPKLVKNNEIIIPFDEMQHIRTMKYNTSWGSCYTLVVASDSEVFYMDGLSYDQGIWLGKLILAGACGKLTLSSLNLVYYRATEDLDYHC